MSNSDSSPSSDTTSTDSRKVLGENSTFADNGANSGNTSNLSTAWTDASTSNLSTAWADNSNTDNSNHLSTAWSDNSTSNLSTSWADNSTNTTNVLDGGSIALAGQSVIAGNIDTAAALGFGTKAIDSSLGFGAGALADSLAASNDALTKSISFANAADSRANAAAAASAADAAAARSDAFGFAASAAARADNVQQNALDVVAGNTADALAYGKWETGAALDSLNTSAGMVATAYADAKGRGALTDKIMMLAIAGAALVAWQAVKR